MCLSHGITIAHFVNLSTIHSTLFKPSFVSHPIDIQSNVIGSDGSGRNLSRLNRRLRLSGRLHWHVGHRVTSSTY